MAHTSSLTSLLFIKTAKIILHSCLEIMVNRCYPIQMREWLVYEKGGACIPLASSRNPFLNLTLSTLSHTAWTVRDTGIACILQLKAGYCSANITCVVTGDE